MKKDIDIKLKYSRIIPFKGFYACTIFNCIYRNIKYRNTPISGTTLNHEKIHMFQSQDFNIGFCGYFLFYLLYGLEWLLKLPFAIAGYKIYHSLSFEQEAYKNESNKEYLEQRKRFAWVKYIFKLVK